MRIAGADGNFISMAMKKDIRKCPYCAEEIRAEAVYCRYCARKVRRSWWKLTVVLIFAISLLAFAQYNRAEMRHCVWHIQKFMRDAKDICRSIRDLISDIPNGMAALKSYRDRIDSLNRVVIK